MNIFYDERCLLPINTVCLERSHIDLANHTEIQFTILETDLLLRAITAQEIHLAESVRACIHRSRKEFHEHNTGYRDSKEEQILSRCFCSSRNSAFKLFTSWKASRLSSRTST